ncbi:MAG: hypothetical protein A2096_17515 [Spirochaetes bacterium GWF1_41_5]|nr:MAG: hypothetical protein A2096_17515 [Spirochaetes bacterium GWF1_41_5]HBE02718.1 hypothetical protein [Spirochaetia bacterium]
MEISCRIFGTGIIFKHLSALTAETGGVISEDDIECVHRMRVASRRLRRSLAAFKELFPRQEFPVWRKAVKRIAGKLSRARDIDVQTVFLDDFIRTLPPENIIFRRGLRRIRLRLGQERCNIQKKIIRLLESEKIKSAIRALENELQIPGNQILMERENCTGVTLNELAARRINICMENVLALSACADHPEEFSGLHKMRIAFKNLRYEMEIFESLFAKRLADFIKMAKNLQSLLGKIQDAEVWLKNLPRIEKSEEELTRLYCGNLRGFSSVKHSINLLTDNRRRAEKLHYQEFLTLHRKINRRHVWKNLQKILLENSRAADQDYCQNNGEQNHA